MLDEPVTDTDSAATPGDDQEPRTAPDANRSIRNITLPALVKRNAVSTCAV